MAQSTSLPPLMAMPPAQVRAKIPKADWVACVQAWLILTQAYLSTPAKQFSGLVAESNSSLVKFLTSYLETISRGNSDSNYTSLTQNTDLHRQVYLLVHRAFSEALGPPDVFLDWQFLAHLSRSFRHTPGLASLLQSLWASHSQRLEPRVTKFKDSLIPRLESGQPPLSKDEEVFLCLLPLARMVPAVGRLVMTGSDFLDSLVSAYAKVKTDIRSKLLLLAYVGLGSLMDGESSNTSLLLDHLYGLNATAASKTSVVSPQRTFLTDLVTSTPLLQRMRRQISGTSEVRASRLITSLEALRQGPGIRPKRTARARVDKGKTRQADEYGHGASAQVHVHRMSRITQIQDLFPTLGSGFIIKLLDEYNEDIEQVTLHLLEDSLPQHLANADRTEQLPDFQHPSENAPSGLTPRTTPPPSPRHERRNVFDNDEFDRLAVDTSRLHLGRKNGSATADKLLSTRDKNSHAASKAAIISALAAFDADDDERDDTYDQEDVGGTVDSARPGGADEADADIDDMRDKHEETLFSAFSMNPELFARDSTTRRGQPRDSLKRETGMTDEAIEGWAVMIRRDPRRLRRLEVKYATFAGQQNLIETAGGSATEDSEASGAEGGRGGFRGRGRGGRGRGGRGGNAAGPANDPNTQTARRRNEANKSSRANHNRRDQRARKMARGGFPG